MASDTHVWGEDDALVRILTCVDAESLLRAAAAAALPDEQHRAGGLFRRHPEGRLTLDATLGLAAWVRDEYGTLDIDVDLPAAQALRERRPVYSSLMEFPQAVLDVPTSLRRVAAEYASLPLIADGDCMGALILVLPGEYSSQERTRARLRAVATVCAHRWARLLAADSGDDASPTAHVAWDEETEGRPPASLDERGRVSLLEIAMANAGIGSFDWDFATGRLVWDERTCALVGIAPGDFDGRVETFFDALLPGERSRFEREVDESLRTGKFHTVSRIRRVDGVERWIDIEAQIVHLRGGVPRGMIGVAKDRTEDMERRAARKARGEFVLGLTSGLTGAVTPDDVFTHFVENALPRLGARWSAVHLEEEYGGIRLMGPEQSENAMRDLMRAVGEHTHVDPLLASVEAGEPLFLESREEWAARLPAPDLQPGPGQHAWALLPMTSVDGLVGVCSLIYDRPRGFDQDDRTVLTAAAGMFGQSLARTRLQETRRRYLTELQRLMLPQRMPEIPGLDVAVCYEPGSEGLEVGGDWYDVVPRSGGRVALIIGDVQGHSVQAAGVMGQLRTAMRAYASEGHGPAGLLERGDQALAELETDLFATCCIAEVDPWNGRLRVARAGHPYPLLMNARGQVQELVTPGGMPLGTFADDYPVTEAEIEPGGALLLFTDGLVEDPAVDYRKAIAALAELLSRSATPPDASPPGEKRDDASGAGDLDEVVRQIAEPAVSEGKQDDIAVLLLRRQR